MAEKPLYYGSSKASPMYYGGKSPMAYGGKPMYGGKSPIYYGASRNYGNYGQYGSYGQYGGGGGEDDSVVGTITVGRILRVIGQRWLSVFVFILVGLIVSFAVYRITPTKYEATSDFSMDIRRSVGHQVGTLAEAMPDLGNNYAEIFNTRLPEWRSERIVQKILQSYRKDNPKAAATDELIKETLSGSELELQRNSRLITITVRSTDPALAAALANAYADAIEDFTDEENKVRCDKAVSQIHQNVEKKRREVEKIDKHLLDSRTLNKVDNLRAMRETNQQALQKTTADVLSMEREETLLIEQEKMLAEVQKNPESFGNISSSVPRAQEILTEYSAFQKATQEHAALLMNFTDEHPEVKAKAAELDAARGRFVAAAQRAIATGRSMLVATRNQLANLRAKQEELSNDLATLEQRIVMAESELKSLEDESGVARRVLEGLIFDENKLRLDAENNNEIIRVARRATVPTKPFSPNPLIVFGAGVVISLALGLLFVLVLDNIEDTIVNLSDIEGRLSLKVLAVLPHVRLRQREQVAKFAAADKYSQFSETVAGLRNLLDSPRYEAMTHCMLVISTQPGEGKTITSTSMAISYAQAGRRVLHVDFDLRRPRLARVWNLKLTEERSFSHTLQRFAESCATGKDVQMPNFEDLVNKTDIQNLETIASLPPDGVSPSSILGSSVVSAFFEWARSRYDRIIIDAPPFGVVGDVVSLAMLADGIVIMCRPDRTHFKPIQFCSRTLTEAGANILGVIVNDVEVSNVTAFSPSLHHAYGYKYGYKYGSGYGYGYGYRPAKGKKKNGEGDDGKKGDAKDAAKDDAKDLTTSVGEEAPQNRPHHSQENPEFTDDE